MHIYVCTLYILKTSYRIAEEHYTRFYKSNNPKTKCKEFMKKNKQTKKYF